MAKLDPVSLADVTTYINPEVPTLTTDSPASLFMTDFNTVQPVTIKENTPVTTALRIMKEAHVRMLIVTDAGEKTFHGLVTAVDITGGKVLAYMATNEVGSREDVRVRDVMTDREHLHGFDYDHIEAATIGDVIDTIKHLNEQHVMVIEDSRALRLRGVFSTTNIARLLRIDFDVEPHAKTFFELEQVIVHAPRAA